MGTPWAYTVSSPERYGYLPSYSTGVTGCELTKFLVIPPSFS